ncbi:hypothetical protein PF007_g20864 [Phytophthora fragariae]|uniref:MULE transposase domain-containing protein n=2 Tax=Phytophthora fragariae TaxID=53985 RepID=A0A6A3SD84_9STRA|nr:hypothetical protein PF009_g21810 [Phytophthora fragariae]KAE9086205.1 hypothetical protein PF007_g20864 [Phytophthora fragariae]KAE9113392.1 hypothetical protein PF006_g19751 [Phytophthora fragariae]
MNTMRPHAPLQVQQINEFSGGERAWSSAIQTAHSRTWPDMIPNYFVENYTPEFDLTCSLNDRELDVILDVPRIPSQAETHHVDGFLDRSNAAVSPGPYVDTTRSYFPPLMNHHGGYGCLPLPPMRAVIDNDAFGSSTSTNALHPRSTVTTMNAAAGSSVALGMDMATPAILSEVHRPPVRQQQTETTQILDFTKNRNDEREAKESYKRVSIHSTKACVVLHLHSRDPFYHVVKYNYGPKDKWGTVVYGCVSHQKCGHRVRVTSFKSFDVADKIVFAVEEKGKHSEIMSNRKRIGIHPMVKAEIDAMLAAGGSGPSGILTRLVLKYKHEGMREFRERLPKAAKIKNRRSYLSERLGLDWKIKSLVDLNEWCTPRVCDTAEKFFGPAGFDRSTDSATFAAASFSFRSDLLVLGSFRHDFVQDGVAKESFGVVMTSRQIFRNVLYAAEGQGNDGVFAAADGTYELHYGGWTLVVFGTYQTRYTTRKYQKHFVPWAYLFVRTEHQVAYEHLFRSVVRCADEWFNVQLKVTYGSLDHAACIANAFQAVWPEILLLDCYAHVARKCRNSKKLRDPDFYKDNVKINVVQMHKARSTAQFDALTALILAFWRSSGESEYADWFSEIYLHER